MTAEDITPEGSAAPVYLDSTVVIPSDGPIIQEPTQADIRQAAYVAEADPLFFKVQRGEATEQEWLGKVQQIRKRYPYTEGEM